MGTVSLSATARPAAGQTEALSGAYMALLAFFVVYCARPEDFLQVLAVVPLAKITGALAVLALVLTLGSGRRRLPREMLYFALLTAQLWLTVPFSTVWRGGAFWQTLGFSKLLLILPVMLIAAGTLPRLRGLLFVQAGSAALVALVSVVVNRQTHERLTGAANGEYGNPNDLAMALSIALPFCFAFLLRGRGLFRKMAWTLAIVIMLYAVFLTVSRAGLLALAVSMGACIWEFGVRGGRRYLVVLAGVAAIVLVTVAGKGLLVRFFASFGSDLSTRQGETAYESAQERREMLRDSIILTLKHPLFGVGPGNFTPTTGHWRETHNNYTQVSCEGGIPALVLFLMILWRAFANIRETRKRVPKGSDEALWAGALYAGLLAFSVGSFFNSVAYLFYPYFLVAYTSILREAISPGAPGAEAVAEKPAPRLGWDLFRLGRAGRVSTANHD